ncbi:MAG TPA: hypothetical protein VG939_06710 [Caulobacteraceae bacterium]|nr:hypothetical protein [Caulobacteraceae bacterium]
MLLRSGFAAGLLAAALISGSAAAAPVEGPASTHPCFFITQWEGWKAPDANTLYLRVNMHDVYRVDLSAGSSQLMDPGVHLISNVRGSSSICNAIDLDLKVSDGHGFSSPLIARSIRKLTPEEVAAIPKKFRP